MNPTTLAPDVIAQCIFLYSAMRILRINLGLHLTGQWG